MHPTLSRAKVWGRCGGHGLGPGAALVNFQVVSAQGGVSVLTPPNFEAQSNINFTVAVSDGLISVSRPVVVTVRVPSGEWVGGMCVWCHLPLWAFNVWSCDHQVLNVNEAPVFAAAQLFPSIDEGLPLASDTDMQEVCAVKAGVAPHSPTLRVLQRLLAVSHALAVPDLCLKSRQWTDADVRACVCAVHRDWYSVGRAFGSHLESKRIEAVAPPPLSMSRYNISGSTAFALGAVITPGCAHIVSSVVFNFEALATSTVT
jgi:hypothetical protein